MTNPKVLDLSHYQPEPDWAKLKANGTIGVIHKATEGNSYVDPTLFSRAKAAMEAGLCWSTYHFLRPGDMVAQMTHYLYTVDPKKGERMCLDHEDSGVTLEDLCEAVDFLLSDPRELQVTIYSGNVIKEQIKGQSEESDFLGECTSLWLAQYSTTPSWPTIVWPQWSLWQYTDQASAVGIAGPVDGDRWNGTDEALVQWFGPKTEPAPKPEPKPEPRPEPKPVPGSVVVGLTVPKGVTVEVWVNGDQVC